MKIYFAGISSNKTRLFYLKEFGAKRVMLTYADKHRYTKNNQRFIDLGLEKMMDSGAFTHSRKGITINLDDYCKYLIDHSIDLYLVLDEIGNPLKTSDNQKAMESNGLTPLPVYHLGSDIKYLDRLVENYDYICLGGTVGSHRSTRVDFFSKVFDRHKNTKFHGLGVGDTTIMRMFPFHSVDQTTWLTASKTLDLFDENGNRYKSQEPCMRLRYKNTIECLSSFEYIK